MCRARTSLRGHGASALLPLNQLEGAEMSDWVIAEHLAEQIYSELLDFATVKWNDHIYGHISESPRQIDVSIRWKFNGTERLTIVQVKDWKKRPDVNDVGSFAAVVDDVRASQGIIVSRVGFSKRARTYARNRGIQLHSLHDAESIHWRKNLTVPILWTEWSVAFNVQIVGHFEELDVVDLRNLRGANNTSIWEQFRSDWNAQVLKREDGVESRFQPPAPLIIEVGRPDGSSEQRSLQKAVCTYKPDGRHWLGQFQPEYCRGVIDYLQEDAFFVTHLPFAELPVERDNRWKQVTNPGRIAVETIGSIVTMELLGLDELPTEIHGNAQYLGP